MAKLRHIAIATNDPKATVHLNWLTTRAQECGSCWQAVTC